MPTSTPPPMSEVLAFTSALGSDTKVEADADDASNERGLPLPTSKVCLLVPMPTLSPPLMSDVDTASDEQLPSLCLRPNLQCRRRLRQSPTSILLP
ncbi:hypothetical protein NL676_012935 [Syzygium grande]|nr:hypothetical protein NL676_012935 [Syzygium grande]